jgi:hypothetical protein
VYAVEFKIGASLAKHQDPSRGAFGQAGGYGRLLTESDSRPGTKFRFIVFGLPKKLKLGMASWKLPVLVCQRTWEAFASDFPKKPLARDLALSLGRLGVGAFPASETQSMKVDTKHSDLGNAIRTMAEVQRRLDWYIGRSYDSNFYEEETDWYFGIELSAASKVVNSAALAKLVKPPGRAIAWIGYQGKDDQQAQLAFYLYCGDTGAQKKVATLLRRKLKDLQVESADPDKRYFNVIVIGRTNPLTSDVEWFCSIFRALAIPLKK